jgi:hypothetical protein
MSELKVNGEAWGLARQLLVLIGGRAERCDWSRGGSFPKQVVILPKQLLSVTRIVTIGFARAAGVEVTVQLQDAQWQGGLVTMEVMVRCIVSFDDHNLARFEPILGIKTAIPTCHRKFAASHCSHPQNFSV